jgi:hypothetical protein
MSGQPLVKPLDAERFRKEYLKTLDLQESNNKKNLDANRLFIKTGLPQQPPDQRSVEEKLEDTERLKVETRPQLRQLMDGGEAEKVVQKATPLQLYFIAQGMPYFVSTLKPRYQRGMFAEVFLGEVDRYIKSLDKPAFESSQVLLKEDMIPIRNMLSNLGTVNTGLQLKLLEKIDKLIANSVSRQDIEAINMMSDPIQRMKEEEMLRERLKDMPTKGQFDMDAEGILARDQTGDIRGANDSARAFSEVLDGAVEGMIFSSPSPAFAEASAITGYRPLETLSGMRKGDLEDYLDEILDADKLFLKRLGTSKATLKEGKKYFTKQQLLDFLSANDTRISQLMSMVGRQLERPARKAGRPVDLETPPSTPEAKPIGGNGIMRKPRMGCGITKKNYNSLQNSDIDWNSGVSVPKSARYMPFGRYVINKRRLGEGIISIRTPCGACLNDIKSERVSPNILGVVRTILGGGSPTFEDIEKMSDDERNYIHKLASRAELLDRLNVPAPDKKKDDQDINKFEIMKGQIMAGNDSEKLHKDFKLLVVRLMDKKLLPKRQATDILFKMASLGY